MAQDAELKLKVSLDLAFFRQQLSTIGTQLGGQSVPIAIRFDKKAIADQYRLLDRYIRGKKFTVELNLVGGLTKNEFDKIKGRLDDLRDLRKVEIPVSIKNGATGTDVDKVIASIKERLAKNQQIKQGGGKLRIETSVKPSITNEDIAVFKKAVKDKLSKIGALEIPTKLDVPKVEDLLKALQKNINRQKPLLAKTSIKPSILSADVKAFKKAVESKLSGITVKINAELETIGGGKTKAQIEKEVLAGLERIQQMGAERMGGGVTEPARRESLRQSLQGRDIGELKDIGRQLGVANVGKFRNTQNLIERIVTEASIEMITKYLDPQAVMRNPDRSGLNKVLDTFARGLLNTLGMDVASMRQQAAQRRALPGVNFPATVPSRPVSIGPSGTGRALPPGAIPGALPGTAFGAQKYLPTNLGIELQEILRKAAYAFVDAVRQQVRTAKIGIGASMQAALPAARVAGLLPASVGREPSRYAMGGESREQMMARRTAEAYARSALRGVSVMSERQPALPGTTFMGDAFVSGGGRDRVTGSGRVPERGGAIVPFTGSTALPKNYLEVGKAVKGLMPLLERNSVPFSGAIRELGEEFGFAIKQVLLFGTAYKALAFFTDLPAQALNASKELQSFNNQLNAITGSSSNAQRSVQFINDTVAQFNIPLKSAREGFLRLYASMSPAGMGADTIENLFVGISQASATLGLSADQVDRVTYAFSQMASKGKVMSEEVTGQLGDVIPGALSLMADAAGMSMADFKQAMEDGQVSGKAMEQLFTNLPIVMEQRFGKGAAGAAKTLQGQLNNLATTAQRMYESFEPLVTIVANQVLPLVSSALKDAQSAVEAFGLKIQGINPAINNLSDGAQSFYRNFEIISDTIQSTVSIIQSLDGVFRVLGGTLSGALQLFNALIGNPIGEVFIRLAVNIGIATAAIKLFVNSGLIAAIQQLGLLIANIGRAVTSFRALTAASRSAKIAVGGIVLGGVLVGFEMLVDYLSQAKKETDALRQSALATADALQQMTFQQLRSRESSVQKMIKDIETLQAAAGGKMRIASPTPEQEAMAQQLGLPIAGRAGQRGIIMTKAEGLKQQLQEQLPQIRYAMNQKFNAPSTAATITPIDLEEGKGGEKEKGKVSLDRLVSARFAQLGARLKAEMELAREETAALAPETIQAERMLKYYSQFRQELIDIAIIQAQIEDAEKNRAAYIKDGMSASELDYNLQQLRNELQVRGLSLLATEQKYRNEASKDAAKEAQERKKEQETLSDKLLEIRRENGYISTIEYNRLKIDREIHKIFEDLPNLSQQQKEEIEGIIRNKQTILRDVNEEIELLRIINDEERRRAELRREGYKDGMINQIIDAEKVRDNIKAVRETIDSFVTDTSSDYKGFLKEVISGEDAVESLKKFQEGLKDRVLTIFLDFAMAPVEKFFKEGLSKFAIENFFPKGAAENMPEETKPSTTPIEAQDKNTAETKLNTEAIKANTAAMTGAGGAVPTPGQTTAAGTSGGFLTGTAALQTLPFNGNTDGMLQNLPFPTGNTSILSNLGIDSEELSASISKNADAFSSQLSKIDTSVFESATALSDAGTELGKEGAAGKKWQESLGQAVGGLGMAAGAVMGIVAGINQVKEGGTSNVLGGIGMIASMAGSLLGSFGGLFGGGAGLSSIVQGKDVPIAQMPAGMQFANGGIAPGGFRAFANGGMVSGPTLGLIGEGKYNEAVVPLPNGKSIPVQFSGERSARDMMSRNAQAAAQASPINLSFETTKIGNTEYVSRDQLEAAMAETRRAAINGGAARGMSMTLDRIQQSPSVRSRIGIR